MVNRLSKKCFAAISLLLIALSCSVSAVNAAVIASVDRANVELNESFTFKVLVDTAIDIEPDASALDTDFLLAIGVS